MFRAARVLLVPAIACGGLVAMAVSAQSLGRPDLRVEKSCAVNGPQSVLCTVTVTNIGQVATTSPINLSDTPSAPAGSTYTGAGGSLPVSCSLGAGPVQPIPCTIHQALQPGASGTVLFSFQVGKGRSFGNCVTVSQPQTAAVPSDPNPSNNTNICTSLALGGGDDGDGEGGGGGPIDIDTPKPGGACAAKVQVSGMHYPQQTCAQSTPGFLAGMMTSHHLTSKCPKGTQLIGVIDVSCQNAPIPGFSRGSVYEATACCGRLVPPPGGGITIVKKIVNKHGPMADPGPFVVQVKCDPSVSQQTVTLAGPGFQHTLVVARGATCKIEEVQPKAPDGCRWITTYPNGQSGKDGDTLVVQNELSCGGQSECPRGQGLVTFPGSKDRYCCEGKPGNDKFCCNKVRGPKAR